MKRGRIDYARIPLSTTSLEVLNKTIVLLVDGQTFSIKMVEEWGCHLGEDVFLTEEASDQCVHNVDVESEFAAGHGLEELCGDVDALVDDIQKEWRDHEAKAASVILKNVDSNNGGNVRSEKAAGFAADADATLQQSEGDINIFPALVDLAMLEDVRHQAEFDVL